MSGYDEEHIAELLRFLPPAPAGWVEARPSLVELVRRQIAE
jgi:hypothetical protein